MKNAVQSQKAMYSYGYESKARELNGFAEMFDLPDFEERRAKLVAGLDEESTAVVNRILRRLKTILKLKEGETVDLYTRGEQEAFAEANARAKAAAERQAAELAMLRSEVKKLNKVREILGQTKILAGN